MCFENALMLVSQAGRPVTGLLAANMSSHGLGLLRARIDGWWCRGVSLQAGGKLTLLT